MDGAFQDPANPADAPDPDTADGLALYHSIVDRHLTHFMTVITTGNRFKLDLVATTYCVKDAIQLGEIYASRQDLKQSASDEELSEEELNRSLAEHPWPAWWPAGWMEEIVSDRQKQPKIDAYTLSE